MYQTIFSQPIVETWSNWVQNKKLDALLKAFGDQNLNCTTNCDGQDDNTFFLKTLSYFLPKIVN